MCRGVVMHSFYCNLLAREAMEIWDAMLTYAAGLSPPVVGSSGSGTDSTLLQGLRAVGEQAEPQRVGSAYALAKAGNIHALCKGLHSERENVRRAAAYGLATLSDHLAENAVPLLVELCKSAAKSTRKYASFVLGEMAPLSPPVVKTLTNLLLKDESAYVRHCAGGALGCCGIRAIAQKQGLNELSSVIEAFVQSLEIEENRYASLVSMVVDCPQVIIIDWNPHKATASYNQFQRTIVNVLWCAHVCAGLTWKFVRALT